MNDFPWGVGIILGSGLIFTMWCIYYILRLAYLETKDETTSTNSVGNKSSH
jgi:hypothetical protein